MISSEIKFMRFIILSKNHMTSHIKAIKYLILKKSVFFVILSVFLSLRGMEFQNNISH